jgi:hypothetical protein
MSVTWGYCRPSGALHVYCLAESWGSRPRLIIYRPLWGLIRRARGAYPMAGIDVTKQRLH